MKRKITTLLSKRASQSGSTLMVVLVLILCVSFIGISAMGVSLVQERMAGNTRDQNLALQMAEAALRDAEADIEANINDSTGFTSSCTNGLCLPPSIKATGASSTPIWKTVNWTTNSRKYGSITGAPALVGPGNTALSNQPRYIIEVLPELPGNLTGSSVCTNCTAASGGQAFRITVRAWGAKSTTMVMLQSTYIKQ